MTICNRCELSDCESLFNAECGCNFCSKCIAECHTLQESLCKDHGNPNDASIDGRKRKHELGDNHCSKKMKDFCKDCFCMENTYSCKFSYLGCNFRGSPIEIDKHQSDVEAHLKLSTANRENNSIKLEDIQEMINKYNAKVEENLLGKLEEQVNTHKQILEKNLLEKLEKTKEELSTDIVKKLDANVNFPAVKHSYSHVWKIENFSKLQTEHETGTSIMSEPFFTGSFGYKMSLELYPNGYEGGKDTHLSVFICVMKGPWDDILKWPITYTAKLMLLAQHNKSDHHSYTMTTDLADKICIGRPVDDDNEGWGEPKFFLLDNLKPLYLVDDVIYLRMDISTN